MKHVWTKEPEWLTQKRKKDSENSYNIEKISLTKQQLIFSKKFFLQLNESEVDKDSNHIKK